MFASGEVYVFRRATRHLRRARRKLGRRTSGEYGLETWGGRE